MSLKAIANKINVFFDNKYALIFLLPASFFVMLSFKVVPVVYTLSRDFDINSYKIFPLSWFDYIVWIIVFAGLKIALNFLAEYPYEKRYIKKFPARVLYC